MNHHTARKVWYVFFLSQNKQNISHVLCSIYRRQKSNLKLIPMRSAILKFLDTKVTFWFLDAWLQFFVHVTVHRDKFPYNKTN
jgi:hypothetical protein